MTDADVLKEGFAAIHEGVSERGFVLDDKQSAEDHTVPSLYDDGSIFPRVQLMAHDDP